MKRRSVWVVAVASMMLLATSQTDHAFAALKSLTNNSTPQNLSSASWAAVAGVDQNVTSADRAGNAYPMTLTSSCSAGDAITRTTTGSVTGSGRTITLTTAVTGLEVGYLVSGSGVSSSYSLNTNPSSSSRRIDSFPDGPNGFRIRFASGTSTTPSGTVLTFTIAKQIDNTLDSNSSGTNDRKRIQTIETVSELEVGMTVRGSNIANSGTNTIVSFPSGSNDEFITASGPNIDNAQIIAFSNATVCTYFSLFYLRNTGDTSINSMSITQTGSAVNGTNTITWSTCSGSWSGSTCSGSEAAILTATTISPQQLTRTLAPMEGVWIRAVSSPAGSGATLNISVSVSTSDLRAATNTNA